MPDVITCSNCSDTSVYVVTDPGADVAYFCSLHLPDHLLARAAAGQFQIL